MQAAREALVTLPAQAPAAAAPRKGASGVPAARSARRPPLLALVFPCGADAEADGRAASQEALVRALERLEYCCTSAWQGGPASCGPVLPLCVQARRHVCIATISHQATSALPVMALVVWAAPRWAETALRGPKRRPLVSMEPWRRQGDGGPS